jgi:DtxR family Mn-dependent transcriptional regulator
VPPKVAASTSESTDDYLKAILVLGGADETPVSSNALAERLGIRAASVTGMLQKLALQRPALVLYQKHRGVRLSLAGKRRAWELIRHHRLLELFLHDILKYSWDEVHEEAERLEHFISERFEDRLAAMLGDPEVDPHGHPIPHKDDSGPFRDEVPLLRWPVGNTAVVSSVFDRDSAILRELDRLGIAPSTAVIVEESHQGKSLIVRIAGREGPVRLSNKLASAISVIAQPASS